MNSSVHTCALCTYPTPFLPTCMGHFYYQPQNFASYVYIRIFLTSPLAIGAKVPSFVPLQTKMP